MSRGYYTTDSLQDLTILQNRTKLIQLSGYKQFYIDTKPIGAVYTVQGKLCISEIDLAGSHLSDHELQYIEQHAQTVHLKGSLSNDNIPTPQ